MFPNYKYRVSTITSGFLKLLQINAISKKFYFNNENIAIFNNNCYIALFFNVYTYIFTNECRIYYYINIYRYK